MKLRLVSSFALILAFATNFVWAHHSVNYHFDPETFQEIEGVVQEFHFRNPHSGLVIDVEEADGSIDRWIVEMVGRATLIKQGWTSEQFVPGQRVTISGFLARREEHSMYLRTAQFSDGSDTSFVYGQLAASEEVGTSNSDLVVNPSPLGNWVRGAAPSDPNATGQPRGPGELNPYLARLSGPGKAAAESYDPTVDDPSINCVLPSIVRVWGQPDFSPTNISQTGNVVTIRHEMFDVVRQIYLDGGEIPESYQPKVLGYSTGYFDDGTLVIETTGFPAGVLLPHPGVPHSDQLRIIERLSVDGDTGAMRLNWTAIDPLYYAEPQSGENFYIRSEVPVGVFDCEY